MSDKQTTAVILLVILSLIFYLYHTQRLTALVSAITGGDAAKIGKTWNTSTDSAYIATQAQSANVSYAQFANGQDTAYTLNSIFNITGNGQGGSTVNYGKPSNNGHGLDSTLSTITKAIGIVTSIL